MSSRHSLSMISLLCDDKWGGKSNLFCIIRIFYCKELNGVFTFPASCSLGLTFFFFLSVLPNSHLGNYSVESFPVMTFLETKITAFTM